MPEKIHGKVDEMALNCYSGHQIPCYLNIRSVPVGRGNCCIILRMAKDPYFSPGCNEWPY